MTFLQDITFGRHFPANSFLHRLDPRTKLICSLAFMTCLLTVDSLLSIFLITLVAMLGIAFSGIPIKLMLGNLRSFLWLIGFTFLIHTFSGNGSELFVIPGLDLAVTIDGIYHGFIYCLRLIILIVFSVLLTMTTTPMELADGIEKLMSPLSRFKFPVHEFTLMITLSLRFLPILIDEAQRIKNSQLSRGASLKGSLISRIRNLIPMILPLFLSSIRRAEDLAIAMETRNYVRGIKRSSFARLSLTRNDYGSMIGSCLFIGFMVLL